MDYTTVFFINVMKGKQEKGAGTRNSIVILEQLIDTKYETRIVRVLASNLFADHVPGTMPSLSIFSYLDSTHFSEIFGISYMVVNILLLQYKAFNIF